MQGYIFSIFFVYSYIYIEEKINMFNFTDLVEELRNFLWGLFNQVLKNQEFYSLVKKIYIYSKKSVGNQYNN